MNGPSLSHTNFMLDVEKISFLDLDLGFFGQCIHRIPGAAVGVKVVILNVTVQRLFSYLNKYGKIHL